MADSGQPPGFDEEQYGASIDYALQEVKESFSRAGAARDALDAKAATLVGFVPVAATLGAVRGPARSKQKGGATMGPIIIFDKSTLQSLNVDESVWLDTFYLPNITPLFFVETLADLEKEVDRGRTPEQVVGNLAEKAPTQGLPNVHHVTLCSYELLGQTVELRGVPAISGGRPVVSGGHRGVVFDEPPEMMALKRWQEAKFLEVERDFARDWRKSLSDLDLKEIYREGREIIDRLDRPRDLAEAKAMALAVHDKTGSRYTREGLKRLALPENVHRTFIERWRAAGEPPITRFAPFTAHVLIVDSFFAIALGADFISRERPSNKVDIAYLYYLPFCMVFTSSDNLHAKTARLFMDESQVFVRGNDLKADLARLDTYYSALPEEVKERGVMSFAHYPPTDIDFLTSRLWDKLMNPNWRDQALGLKQSNRGEQKLSEENEKALIARINQMADAPRDARELALDEAEAVLFQRRVPVREGKWSLLPHEFEQGTSR